MENQNRSKNPVGGVRYVRAKKLRKISKKFQEDEEEVLKQYKKDHKSNLAGRTSKQDE